MSNEAIRVLIADDAYINRMILSSLLSSYGLISDEAENGRECLELCQKNTYDLIFLDQNMPELDGNDTLMRLKALFEETGQKTPVICHTADTSTQQMKAYQAAGYTDVLGKPAQPQQVAALLAKYLPDGSWTDPRNSDGEQTRPENELAQLPEWVRNCPGLDPSSGIAHCQTAWDYLAALTVFVRSISDRTGELEHALEKEDWRSYTRLVHSLKSTARLVGADALSGLAEALESAGDQTDIARIKQDTPALLEQYRSFLSLLSHISRESEEKDHGNSLPGYVRNSVLFIGGDDGFIPTAIVNKLRTADFEVICLPDNADIISEHKADAQILLYYLPKTVEQALRSTPALLNLCRREHKTLCLAGEPFPIERLKSQEYSDQIYAFYPRPIDIDEMVADMKRLSASHDEFHRLKTVLVVDDDPSFQKIISSWLSADYNIVSVASGTEALTYLERTRPDLILLDYEMPEFDGYQVLEQIRQNPMTAQVPIIFLTGKNDKDTVVRILQRKPDGYLLKSLRKKELLDALNRFFVNAILESPNKK
ncbi:MAG: response regulator [Lachnospiraceae bacterium]|nr:response regulator [Lachnospiraceae bacterium]